MINLKNTYLGFTSNMKPLQAGKAQKSLDMLVRYNGKVMSEKEFVLLKLQEGYEPTFEENYQYYKRNGELSKPKTLYKLESDNGYQEINKTLYNYAQYILKHNFTDQQIVENYILEEQKQIEESERIEAEQKAKERQEKEEKARIEREKENIIRQGKIKVWAEKGNALMNEDVLTLVRSTISAHFVKYEIDAPEEEKENFINDFIQSLPQKLGNEAFITSTIQYYLEKEESKKNCFHPMNIEAEILMNVFGIQSNDHNRAITAKVKATYENREYKGSTRKKNLKRFM